MEGDVVGHSSDVMVGCVHRSHLTKLLIVRGIVYAAI